MNLKFNYKPAIKIASIVKNKITLIALLTLISQSHADPCNEIIHKVIQPPPAYKLLENGNLSIIDPKERYEISKQYRQDIQKITELIGEYIALRRQTEEINAYLSWQWERVRNGIEYKKDIWQQQIKENQTRTRLKSIERQLYMLGVSQKDLELCYKASN